MTSSEIELKIRTFIGQNFLYAQGVGSIHGTDSLMEKGIVDSTGVPEMIACLEKEFGVTLQDEESVAENLLREMAREP